MKHCLLCHVKPGMVLARPVMVGDNRCFHLTANTILSQRMINQLVQLKCESVYIGEPYEVRTENQNFESTYLHAKESLQTSFDKIRRTGIIPVSEFQDIALKSIELINCDKMPEMLLSFKKNNDHYTLTHSFDVGLIAGAIMKSTTETKEVSQELIMAGLLHDVGKIFIEEEILNKPEELKPYELDIIRNHPYYGYQLAQSTSDISEVIKMAILYHHERLDGSGYPDNLKGDQIPFEAQVIAVADVYAAMTSKHIYRPAISSLEVIRELLELMFGKLNPSYCLTLTNKLKDLLIGNDVCLNNGTTGKIIYFNNNLGYRPLIQLSDGQYLDLDKTTDIQVARFNGE